MFTFVKIYNEKQDVKEKKITKCTDCNKKRSRNLSGVKSCVQIDKLTNWKHWKSGIVEGET